MKYEHYYEDNKLHISQTNWDELKKDKSSIPFCGVLAAAKETISQGGAFIIYCEVTSDVMRSCDRMSELNEEVGSIAS
jgi:hypothetical protein